MGGMAGSDGLKKTRSFRLAIRPDGSRHSLAALIAHDWASASGSRNESLERRPTFRAFLTRSGESSRLKFATPAALHNGCDDRFSRLIGPIFSTPCSGVFLGDCDQAGV